ncbi:hypothetical protein HMPREF3293_01858 [Christensenella minuta]|uniref:Uncharacterized protein n=1 Tax=Christensenella minuta TaxID=626937 RepID=A0A136Q3M5_9FIRM|nr:hypothetical protein HMPREF3293_01858 [Christensenella minuta]
MERNQGYTILKKRCIGNTGFALGYNLGKMPPPPLKAAGSIGAIRRRAISP